MASPVPACVSVPVRILSVTGELRAVCIEVATGLAFAAAAHRWSSLQAIRQQAHLASTC